jgi:flagellar biosynthesis protein FlhG
MLEETTQTNPVLIAVASGKGGVGKSVIAASMGVGFSMLKQKTVVVDADFGGSNLHQIVGVSKPAVTYQDFQSGRVKKLNDIVSEHSRFQNLGMIFGAAGSYGMANEKYFSRLKFLRNLRTVEADVIILDLGAGSRYQVLDLFSVADHSIVVINPDPLSLSESFNFIKQVVVRNLSRTLKKYPEVQSSVHEFARKETFRANINVGDLIAHIETLDEQVASQLKARIDRLQISLLLNKVTEDSQVTEAGALQKALRDLLSIQTDFMGLVHQSTIVERSLQERTPFIAFDPKSKAAHDLANIILLKLLHRNRFSAFWDRRSMTKELEGQEGGASEVICTVNCMYWQECGYRQGGYPCKLQHMAEMGFQDGGEG